MARFWILSDLHQEYADNAIDLLRPSVPFDAVIAAGDICGAAPDAVAWLRRMLPNDRIVYVPGNHCYWQDPALADRRKPMADLLDDARDLARIAGIDLLSDDSTTIGGVTVHGATLWTDYQVERLGSLKTVMKTVTRRMNDYNRIRRPSSSRPTKPIRPEDLLTRHRASVEFLDAAMGATAGPQLVVTHHAPHPRSLMTPMDECNPAYASDLTWLMTRHAPALWVHGHVHVPSDYVVDRTRIVCNPRGYASEPQQRRWDPAVIVEV